MIVVLDTNVIIGALLSRQGGPAEIICRWEAGEIEVATSPALLEELERALSYPRVQKYLGVSERDLHTFLKYFRSTALTIEPQFTVDVVKKDPDDNRVFECAIAAEATFIVSGNVHLQELKEYEGIVILSPASFITMLELGRGETTGDVLLRDVTQDDLAIFFEQQLDPDANYMAAFTAKEPADRQAFMAHWTRILGDKTITKKTILFDGQVAGHVVSFEQFGTPEVSYWIGREFWGKGIATRALSELLGHVKVRPLYARAAKDNIASLRVLQKCGFTISGEDKGFANARGAKVEEFILVLGADEGGAAQ
jgi:putative PIN family toxin of toxin-antitoxin system